MKNLILILLGGVFFLTSCTNGVEEKKADALYVVNVDSSIIVYKHGAKEPIILKKPIMVDELKKYSIPYSVITASDKKAGMTRYVEGEDNDTYGLTTFQILFDTLATFFIVIVIIALIKGDD